MRKCAHLVLILLWMSFLAAQDQQSLPVHIEKLNVVREGKDVLVELSLSQATTPSVETATNPDRIVLILPNTVSLSKQQRVPVNYNGLQTIRIGLNSAEPPVTRVVLDLDSVHTYKVATQGAKIILKVQATTATASSSAGPQRNPPRAAASGPLVDMFRRRPKISHPGDDDSGVAGVLTPPPARPPIDFPDSGGVATTASAQPSAAHPNYGSLQQGVAFPGLAAPEAGIPPKSSQPAANDRGVAALLAPPRPQLPVNIPASQDAATTASAQPSAAHPSDGNLQQGVAFPGSGAPGADISTKGANPAAEQQKTAGIPVQVPTAPLTAPADSAQANSSEQAVSQPDSAQPQSSSTSEVSSSQPQLPAIANLQPASVEPAPSLVAAAQPSSSEPEATVSAASPPSQPQPSTALASEPNSVPVVSASTLPPEPAAPLGAGVTGKAKDATLGSDEEAAIRATLPADKHLPAERNGDSSMPVAVQLSGAATAGYYQASTSNGYVSHEASPVGSMRLDASGYLYSPGFLNFTVKPQGSLGRQSSEGVFPDGEGVSATSTFLGGGVAPLTVFYHRLNRKVVTFGPMDRLAGLEANTSQDSLGANWKLRLKHLPELGLNYSSYSDSYEPLAALAPKTANNGRLLSADLTETLHSWNLQARYKRERSSQDLINIFDPTQAPYLYKRSDQDVRASADREFGKWLSTSLVAGTTKSENEVQGRPFDQSFRFLTSNSFFRPSKKLTFGFRAGVTDNVVGANLESAIGGDPSTPGQTFLLVPTQAKLQMINYSGSATYAFTKDLRAQADVTHETTRAPQNSSIAGSTSELTAIQTGLAFVHRFRWWQFQSYYAVNGGRFTYAASGSSRTSGQRANAGVTIGSLQSLELTAGVHGSLQNVTGNTYVYDRSAGANVTLSRSLRDRWRLRATYDQERDQYKFSGTQFSSVGNGISVAVVHPRAEFTASHNIRDGLTFQADPRLQFVSSGQGAPLLGAFPGTLVVPTGANWSSAALAFHPVPKFTGRVAWLNSRQRLQSAVSNYYTEWEVSAGYQFRSITVDVGYLFHDQNFATDLFKRDRLFFRVVREFTIY
jgi:AMIN domain-containing protein